MSYMKPEIWEADFYTIETSHGTEIVPVEASGEVATVAEMSMYLEGDPYDPDEVPELHHGWIARMTEPGGMNSTEPVVAPTYKEALAGLRESENLCPDCDGYLDEWSECPDCEDAE